MLHGLSQQDIWASFGHQTFLWGNYKNNNFVDSWMALPQFDFQEITYGEYAF